MTDWDPENDRRRLECLESMLAKVGDKDPGLAAHLRKHADEAKRQLGS